jgi:hypothetical protein
MSPNPPDSGRRPRHNPSTPISEPSSEPSSEHRSKPFSENASGISHSLPRSSPFFPCVTASLRDIFLKKTVWTLFSRSDAEPQCREEKRFSGLPRDIILNSTPR